MASPDPLEVSRRMKGMVNQRDVEAIIKAQQETLNRLEKSNAMLTSCNNLSAQQLSLATSSFTRHTNMLLEMRKDLQSIFSRIRTLRSKLETQHPGEFSMAIEQEVQNVAMQTTDTDDNGIDSTAQQELFDSATQSHFSSDSNKK